MLGFGLWDFEYAIFTIEVIMAVVAAGLYVQWAMTNKKSARWFIGPALVIAFFVLLIVAAMVWFAATGFCIMANGLYWLGAEPRLAPRCETAPPATLQPGFDRAA